MALTKITGKGAGNLDELGIGTSTVDSALHVEQNASGVTETSGSTLKIHNTNASGRSKISLHNNAETASGSIYYDTDSGMLALQGDTGAGVAFHTGGNTEAARIDTSGRLLLNRTSNSTNYPHSKLQVLSDSAVSAVTIQVATNGYAGIAFLNASGTYVGSVAINASSTAFNTSSDHRLKQGVEDMTGAIDRVKALAPKRFQFTAEPDTTVDGFLAHEAQAVVPEAVTGNKDAVDADDNPVYQGIDQSKLVPLLTGALKEAVAKIEALEARVKTLEDA